MRNFTNTIGPAPESENCMEAQCRKQIQPESYDSLTTTPEYTTAHKIGKEYLHEQPVSDNPNKESTRTDDGQVSSSAYATNARNTRKKAQGNEDSAAPARHIHLDYHHPLEDYLSRKWFQRMIGRLAKTRKSGKTAFEEIVESFANPKAPLWHRIKYWPLHFFIRRVKGSVSDERFRERIAEHQSTLRGFVATARSVAEFGLTLPQRFSVPLIVIWNFTNQCNLRCLHCYQDSDHKKADNELTLDEKLKIIDRLGDAYVPMMSFAGGEPTISKDLMPVLQRCKERGIHTSLATNGTTITPEYAKKLADVQCKYIEISLDSTDPDKHDAFRGQPGMWKRTVEGMKNVVAQDGIRLGIAMCIHQGNYDELEKMIDFAVDIGASTFAWFNFIPVGRGLEMAKNDLTPQQREHILKVLNETMQSERISIMSTAPQLCRVSLAYAPLEGKQACSHVGGGGGEKARVVAKYVGGCGAGRCYICIEPDGTITPCVYMPQRVLGNVRNRDIIDIFRNNEFWEGLCNRELRTGHCEVCEFKYYCGGCRARSDAYFGTYNGPDPGCILNSKHWDDITQTYEEQSANPSDVEAPAS